MEYSIADARDHTTSGRHIGRRRNDSAVASGFQDGVTSTDNAMRIKGV